MLGIQDICPMCQTNSETVEHLFRDCPYANEVRSNLKQFMPIIPNSNTNLIDWFLSHWNSHFLLIEKCLIVCWKLWDQLMD